MYKLLDISGEHSLRQLNAVLPAGARHVTRLLYAEYTKYHKYSRRPTTDDTDDYIRCLYTG